MDSSVMEEVSYIGASVVLLTMIIYNMNVPISVIENAAEMSYTDITGTNYRMSSIIHLSNSGEELGVIEESRYNEIQGQTSGYCTLNIPGFGDDEKNLYYWAKELECNNLHNPIAAIIIIESDQSRNLLNVLVGGRPPEE